MTTPLVRGLGVIRLSKHSLNPDDPSTSPERQKERIEGIAQAKGITIVGWAEDLNVSAKVAPWDRPELGKWLREPESWDALLMWKTDRLVRSTRDFVNLISWVRGEATDAPLPRVDRPKTIITADGDLDLSSPMGRAVATIIAAINQAELEVIRDRTQDGRKALRQGGRWPGGTVPYGWKPQRLSEGGWKLVLSDETAPIVRDIISRVIDGEAQSAIAVDLNQKGILCPLNHARMVKIQAGEPSKPVNPEKVWTHPTITKILRNPLLIGRMTHNGEVVKSTDRLPIEYAEPMIDQKTWNLLQETLDGKAKPQDRTRTQTPSLLLNVAKCWACESDMYIRTQRVKGKDYRYYICSGKTHPKDPAKKCSAKNIRADLLDETFESLLMYRLGDLEIMRQEKIPAVDHTAEIADIDTALMELAEDRANGLYRDSGGPARYASIVNRLLDRKSQLEAMPVTEASTRLVGTGVTYRQDWQAKDNTQRRLMLLRSDISCYVLRNVEDLKNLDKIRFGPGAEGVAAIQEDRPVVWLNLPLEIERRLQQS
ncbi:recombinase family protein [Micromonospora globbae]|nr:recombinase family protein [Micromonospora globbae]